MTELQSPQPAPNDGGPAFPSDELNQQTGHVHAQHPGMSLLDYFAAKAMHAEIVTCGVPGEACDAMLQSMEPDETVEEHIARTAYRMADAMLKVRSQRTGRQAEASELLAVLQASPHGLHPSDANGPCLCGQCDFVRLRDAAIAKATGGVA